VAATELKTGHPSFPMFYWGEGVIFQNGFSSKALHPEAHGV